jgi:hypothetical protein
MSDTIYRYACLSKPYKYPPPLRSLYPIARLARIARLAPIARLTKVARLARSAYIIRRNTLLTRIALSARHLNFAYIACIACIAVLASMTLNVPHIRCPLTGTNVHQSHNDHLIPLHQSGPTIDISNGSERILQGSA